MRKKIFVFLSVLCALVITTAIYAANQDEPKPATSSPDQTVTITPAPDSRVPVLTCYETNPTETTAITPDVASVPEPVAPSTSNHIEKSNPNPSALFFPATVNAVNGKTPALSRIPTVQEIIDDYQNDTGRLSAWYTVPTDDGPGWILLDETVTEFYGISSQRICPAAVLAEGTEWTTESILESYRKKADPWVESHYFDSTHSLVSTTDYIWDSNFETTFAVDDGWLYINKTRVASVNQTVTQNMTPLALLKAYQNNEIDFNQKVWSADFRTSAEIRYDGRIRFEYSDPGMLDDSVSAEKASLPWWRNEKGDSWKDYQGFRLLDAQSFHRTSIVTDTHINPPNGEIYPSLDQSFYVASIVADMYIDLPNGKIDPSLGQVICVQHDENGTWVTTTTGVYHFYRGELVNHWSLTMNTENRFLVPETEELGAAYAYSDGKLFKLLDNSKKQLLYSKCIGAEWSVEGPSIRVFYTRGDRLMCWTNIEGIVKTTVIVDDNLSDAKWVQYNLLFTIEGDPYTYTLEYGDCGGSSCIGHVDIDACAKELTDGTSVNSLREKYAATITEEPRLTED